MHVFFQLRLIRIARLALGIALFAQFALVAEACLLPQRSLASAPVVASLVDQDQRLPCSDAGCPGQLPEANVCLAEVTAGDQAPGPFPITVTPSTAGLSSFMFVLRNAVAPIAAPRPDIVDGGSGSHLSIRFCSFQI